MSILIITSHPDDIEFSMGGTLSRLKREGHDIRAHIFSLSVTIDGNEEIKNELAASLQGVYDVDFTVHDYPTMHFKEHYQDIRDTIFEVKRKFNPDVVYCKSSRSLHPDHVVVGEAVESIFIESTIYAMEGIRDGRRLHINKWVVINEPDLKKKLESIKKYKSQADKHYSDPSLIVAWARVRGNQINRNLAEGFEVIQEVS